MGKMCTTYYNEKHNGEPFIKFDPISGKVLNPECNDTNPGSFHIVTVNKIGLRKKPFLMDKTFDLEVWNQPVYKYRFQYFNPVTKKTYSSAKAAMMDVNLMAKDKFKKYRDPRAKSIVDVHAWITYTNEAQPRHLKTLNKQYDLKAKHTEKITYDLELDEKANIIGGEWHTKNFPDMVLVQDPYSEAYTELDRYITGNSIQERIKGAARVTRQYATETGAPLYKILEKLIELSK